MHNSADIPSGLQPAAYIASSNWLIVSSLITVVRASSKINKWAPKIRQCYFQHEKSLKFFKIYTTRNCEAECRANRTLNKCGCNAYYQPSNNLTLFS